VALKLVESCADDDERRVTTMAETKRMTTEQVVGYLLEGEGLDFMRESLSWVAQQLMEAEVSELVGAARGERAPEERLTHRNG
jgi:transposase-like protein